MNNSAFHKISYGLYLISSMRGEKMNGQIANTVIQVSSEPPTLGIGINKQNLTHDFIKESGKFAVSILTIATPMTFIGRFGFKCGRDLEKFEGVNYKIGQSGVPLIMDYSAGFLEAEVLGSMDCGTHRFFWGEVKACDVLSDAEPMTYAYYHAVKGGKEPKTAPTFQATATKKMEEQKMTRYTCNVCGYLYDPQEGDPDGGIKPGTKFEDLPDNWVCPVCGAHKDEFSPE